MIKEKYKRIIAMFFALNIIFEVISPTMAMALTGGPSQPEVQSFTPISTSDMVNVFSGDFNYNIPLLDVDGYPINLAYNAGITNDMEASWVGLGWNINPGTVNRGMRGLPDDFKGDVIHKEISMKPNQTFGASFGLGFELAGKEIKKLPTQTTTGGLNFSLGLNYNTYNGYGMDMSARVSLSLGKSTKGSTNASLGLNSGTGKGLGISPDVSYSKSVSRKSGKQLSANGSLGFSFNTNYGLGAFTFGYLISESRRKISYNSAHEVQGIYMSSHSSNGGFGYSFADPSYMPSSGPEMVNLGLNLSVTFGTALYASHPKATIGAYYSGQFVKDNTKDYNAYGYLNSQSANHLGFPEKSSSDLMDFNREKDASFTLNTPNLPVTNYTYDNFMYTGQGISGDFRPHRNHVGTVFDPYVKNIPSINGNVGIELGGGGILHGGLNVETSFSQTKTGKWSKRNEAEGSALFHGGNIGTDETVYFKQGGEKTAETDMTYFNDVINGFSPVRMGLQVAGSETYMTKELTTKYFGTKTLSNNKRNARVRRNETVNVLTADKASLVGLETVIKNYPINIISGLYSTTGQPALISRTNGDRKAHHISEITTLRDDGARYVYGVPAYNLKDEQATFAVEPTSINYNNGIVSYSTVDSDNSINNKKALDHYYSSETMPAYAHSYLLSAVLSSDYVDRTQNGPSLDDLGKYTKFNYTKLPVNYKWRFPYGTKQANLNQALYSEKGPSGDDKAGYNFGEKEIWYLHSIETKNYIVKFELEDRLDGLGVQDVNGGADASNKLKRLKTIQLYSRQELLYNPTPVPLKTVHFEYDYSLCDGPNGIENNVYFNGTNPNNHGEGKLTLKKVWFTYQNSQKGKLSPYEFTYDPSANFAHNPKAYDRWGNYKPNNPPVGFDATAQYPSTNAAYNYLLTSEFPYSEQDPVQADQNASAWNLSSIKLPSGATIQIDYEADDYAFVQNKKAMQMFTLGGVHDDIANVSTVNDLDDKLYETSPVVINNWMFLKLSAQDVSAVNNHKTIANLSTNEEAIRQLFFLDENGISIEHLYFKFLLNVQRNKSSKSPKFEYVSGYAAIDFLTNPTFKTLGSTTYLAFKIKDEKLFDNMPSNQPMHPVSMAGINFVRKYMPKVAHDNDQDPVSNAGSNLKSLAIAMKAAFTPIVQAFKGGLSNSLRLSHASQLFVPGKSFVRLYSATRAKKGGGCRVRSVVLSDNWSTQSTNNATTNSDYGQVYDYLTKDPMGVTISSGVASYEPLIGGEENPFRQPVFYKEEHKLAPDDDYYHEEPYGESMFPGSSVGYSRIVVRNLPRVFGSNVVSRHATGAVVHEFYTAKDFPTLTDRTDCKKERHKPNPVAKFLKFFTKDFMTVSQGYQIVLNDMHGKQKAQYVYKEGNKEVLVNYNPLESYYGNNFISGIEYKYKRKLDNLTNDVTVIEKDGTISTKMVGVDYDMVVDTRESETITRVGSINGNLEGFLVAILPATIPTLYPGYSKETVRFRSSVVTKVLYRYGLVDEVIAYDNGAKVSTKNKLYDAETGEVLLTETVNNFSDPVYNLTYPSHWAYDRMGSSAKNLAAESKITAGVINDPGVLVVGDEVLLYGTSNAKGWVKFALPNVQIIDQNGAAINLNNYNFLSIVRSGNRNQQNIPVAKISSLVNPLVTSGNIITLDVTKNTKVINASAAEFKDDWGTFCTCNTTAQSIINPFLTGQKGIFRSGASYVHLCGRDQLKSNSNTNIRMDGPYLSFAPFWKPNNTANPYNWTKTTDPAWQYTTKMSVYSPFGFETENQDALGRNSAAIYGYGYTLPIAVSSNSKYNQIAFDGFEDYDYNTPCEMDHFSYIEYFDGTNTVTYNKSSATNNYVSKGANEKNQKYSHTGRKSIRVGVGATIKINTPVQGTCSPNPNSPIFY